MLDPLSCHVLGFTRDACAVGGLAHAAAQRE